MIEESIFNIPVYITSENNYQDKADRHIQDYLIKLFGTSTSTTDAATHIKDRAYRDFGGPWNFNQIIGWIELFVSGNGLGGRSWSLRTENGLPSKRLQFNMRKRFYLDSGSDILACYLEPFSTSEKIYRSALDAIKMLASSKQYKNRFIDLSNFQIIGPLIDWKTLIDSVHRAS